MRVCTSGVLLYCILEQYISDRIYASAYIVQYDQNHRRHTDLPKSWHGLVEVESIRFE